MRDRAQVVLIVCAAAALLLGACESTGRTNGGVKKPGEGPGNAPVKGQTLYGGKLVLDGVKGPTAANPRAEVAFRNQSKKPVRNFKVTMVFYYRASGEMEGTTTDAVDDIFTLFPGRSDRLVFDKVPNPDKVLRWDVLVEEGKTLKGSEFLGGKLRCEEIQDGRGAPTPFMRFRLKNISPKSVRGVRYSLYLFRGEQEILRTKEERLKEKIGPGQTVTISPKIPKDAFVAGAQFLLIIRQAAL